MKGVNISDRKEDYLELGPNCPPEDIAPTCGECPENRDCEYAATDGPPEDKQ